MRLGTILVSAVTLVAQTPGQITPRIAGKPDFNGIWEANNTANWDLQTHAARPMVAQDGLTPGSQVLAAPVVGLGAVGWVPGGLGVVEGDEIPYQPWAAARKKENLEHWMDRDPEIKCFQPGVPRAMYMPYPFQIVQSATKIEMVFEFANAQRTIHLTKMDSYPNVLYMGYSVGHWEGDTLVVDTTNYKPQSFMGASSEKLHVTERFTRTGPESLKYEITIDDPETWTKPWSLMIPLQRTSDKIYEYACQEGNIGLTGILAGARAEERATAGSQSRGPK